MRNHQIKSKPDGLRKLITIIVVMLNTGFALTLGWETQMIFINVGYILLDSLFHGGTIRVLKNIRIWFACVLFMAMTFVVQLDFGVAFEYGRIMIIMFCAYYITTVFSLEELVVGYCKCMRFIAVVSCTFWLAVRMFPTLPYPTFTNALEVEYYTCLLGNIRTSLAEVGVVRNAGLFWEGGMYAALTTLWLICEIEYLKHERNFWRIIVLGMITIFTTNSTSGYLYMVLLMFLLFSHNSTGRRTIAQSLLLFTGFCAAILVVSRFESVIDVLVRYNSRAFTKIVTQNESFTDRVYGPLADIWTGITNPLGVGLQRLHDHVRQVARDLFDVSLGARTSTLTYFVAAHGPVCGIFVNWQWCRVFLNTIDSKLEKLIVITMFLILATSTPLHYTMVFWIAVFLGDVSKRKKIAGLNEEITSTADNQSSYRPARVAVR